MNKKKAIAQLENVDKTRKEETEKQRLFIESYLRCLNATQAAREAGYKGDANQLGVTGYQNLRKSNIRDEIQRRLKERHLTSEDVLARLAMWSEANLDPFLTQDGEIDFTTPQAQAHIQYLKKARTKKGFTKSGEPWEEIEVELHDAKDATIQIGRHLKLFTDKIELDSEKFTEYRNAIDAFLKKSERVDDSAKGAESDEN